MLLKLFVKFDNFLFLIFNDLFLLSCIQLYRLWNQMKQGIEGFTDLFVAVNGVDLIFFNFPAFKFFEWGIIAEVGI